MLETIIPRFCAHPDHGVLHEITLNAQHTLANLLVNGTRTTYSTWRGVRAHVHACGAACVCGVCVE